MVDDFFFGQFLFWSLLQTFQSQQRENLEFLEQERKGLEETTTELEQLVSMGVTIFASACLVKIDLFEALNVQFESCGLQASF